ncbi:MAG: hypothetical protein RJB66_2723 [Pseudomonadota bacterium]
MSELNKNRGAVIKDYGSLTVSLLPCLKDNYVFVLEEASTGAVIAVDPPNSETIRSYLDERHLALSEIWITHHHHDHVGGVLELQQHYSCKVRGSAEIPGRIPGLTHSVQKTGSWYIDDFQVCVLTLPGHTLDHIAYWLKNNHYSILFSGDVLFGFGCGRVFEGTYEQMIESLNKITSLPDATEVYCAHEYTESNLRFTESLCNDEDIRLRGEQVRDLRRSHQPTVPLSLSEEKRTNLFLRALTHSNAIAEFGRLRDLRNTF